MSAQANVPAPPDDRRPMSAGGATTHTGGARRAQSGGFWSHASKVAYILLAIMFARTLVSVARVVLPAIYCDVKDSVTKQYIPRCCALTDDQRHLLESVYGNLSALPTINDTWCLRYLPRCVLYRNERVECLKMRRRYNSNVFSLLEPRETFTVYTRKGGPGSVLCKNTGFSWVLAVVIPLVNAMLLSIWGFFAFICVDPLCMRRTPARPELSLLGRGGANEGSVAGVTPGENTRPIVT